MGEEAGETVINIDLSKVENKLEEISKSLTSDTKKIVRDCAITLFTNINFENINESPIQIAKNCIMRALILAKELKEQNLLD